jgi:Zn-dependent membrane protease YugP
MRFADEQGRVVRDSTGTTNQKLARKILDKKRVQVVAKKNLSGEILDEFLESDDNIGEIGA